MKRKHITILCTALVFLLLTVIGCEDVKSIIKTHVKKNKAQDPVDSTEATVLYNRRDDIANTGVEPKNQKEMKQLHNRRDIANTGVEPTGHKIAKAKADYKLGLDKYKVIIKKLSGSNGDEVKSDIAEVIELFTKVIKLNPDYTDAYFMRGMVKADLGKYEESIEDFSKVIELYPDYENAHLNRGLIKHRLKNYAEAIEDFNREIELRPDYAHAYRVRGEAKSKLGRYEEAKADKAKAMQLDN